jgi:hypothetical protein
MSGEAQVLFVESVKITLIKVENVSQNICNQSKLLQDIEVFAIGSYYHWHRQTHQLIK